MKKPAVLKQLGSRVSAFRTNCGYTQAQLADRCGYTSKFISEVERGLVNVPLLTLVKIAAPLGVTISELTLGLDGMPQVTRNGAAIYAGRSRHELVAISNVLGSIDELIRQVKSGKTARTTDTRHGGSRVK